MKRFLLAIAILMIAGQCWAEPKEQPKEIVVAKADLFLLGLGGGMGKVDAGAGKHILLPDSLDKVFLPDSAVNHVLLPE